MFELRFVSPHPAPKGMLVPLPALLCRSCFVVTAWAEGKRLEPLQGGNYLEIRGRLFLILPSFSHMQD